MKKAEKGLSGSTACAKALWQEGGSVKWRSVLLKCRQVWKLLDWRELRPGHELFIGSVRHLGFILRAVESLEGGGVIKVYVLENHSILWGENRSERQEGGTVDPPPPLLMGLYSNTPGGYLKSKIILSPIYAKFFPIHTYLW